MIRATLLLTLLGSQLPAQNVWLDRSPLQGPTPRRGMAMAYDANRGVTVMFGGRTGNGIIAETWEWDGNFWLRRFSNSAPSAREYACMVYDTVSKSMFLYGGTSGSSHLSDSWSWDGTTWTRLSPSSSPGGLQRTAMAHDSHRGVTVLFGGRRGTSELKETWEWDGGNWTQNTAANPNMKGRYGHFMGYDAERKLIVCGEGNGGSGTFTYDGKTWSSSGYGGAGYASCCFDEDLRRLVMFGGGGNNQSSFPLSSFELSYWQQVQTFGQPGDRRDFGMCYDSRRRRIVVFGGADRNYQPIGDTWELAKDCRTVAEGHPGGGLPITCWDLPVIGTRFSLAFPAQQKQGLLFVGPRVSGPVLQLKAPTTCTAGTLFVNPLITLPIAGDPAVFSAMIPYNPSFRGLTLSFQGAATQLLGCQSLTDAVEVRVR